MIEEWVYGSGFFGEFEGAPSPVYVVKKRPPFAPYNLILICAIPNQYLRPEVFFESVGDEWLIHPFNQSSDTD